jgi:hypothetical protein
MIVRAFAAGALLGFVCSIAGAALADDPPAARAVRIPLPDLGYRDGVTVAGVAPSVTFDLPRYASLRRAVLELEVHASPDADPASTVAVAVDGRRVFGETLRALGDARLRVPLPVPPASAKPFAITVSGALRVAGDPCATDAARRLFLHVGRQTALIVSTVPGGSAEAFFRDYRGSLDVTGALDDPRLVAVPYRVDRLEPWHRVDATLVDATLPNRRTLVFVREGPPRRRGDVLQLTPAAFAALPIPRGQSPERHDGSIAFGDLRQNLGTLTGVGDLAFDVPLAASVVGGVPEHLHAHVAIAHSALAPGTSGTLQVLVNGVLAGARELGRAAGTQTIDVAVPAAVVGPSNDVRVLVTSAVPPAVCAAGPPPLTASLLADSTFTWSGVERRAPTIESFLTALHGRVAVLVTPAFTRAAFRFMNELGALNSAIVELDVARFDGSVPDGYDAAIVFAPPGALHDLGLPIRPGAASFAVMNPTDGTDVLQADPATTFALLQLGMVRGTPLLAVSYHGDARAIGGVESVRADQLATQITGVSVIDARGATAYDIGDKLRVTYPGDETAEQIWERVRIAVTAGVLLAIAAGAVYCVRRLTGATLP